MQKNWMKIFILAIILFLTGCSREPMIQLSEDNRIKVESKQADRNGADEAVETTTTEQDLNNENDAIQEDDSSQAANIEEEEPLTEENQTASSITIDRSQWVSAPENTEYNLIDYIPVPANQINQYYSEQNDFIVRYTEYYNETTGQYQVRKMSFDNIIIDLYTFSGDQIQWSGQTEPDVPYTNYLETGLPSTVENSVPLTLLASPLNVGSSWTNGENNSSEIIGLYDQIQIEEQTYQEVIEVLTQADNQETHHFYAANIGLVASWQENNDQVSELEFLTDSASEVMLVYEAAIYQPLENDASGALIEEAIAAFSWQTNDTTANAFRRFFQEQNWIGDEISVLNVDVRDGIGVVNFTSGVVATLNEHPAGEQAVIASIVTTVADFLQVDSVRLEVQGNGMLPATIEYPEGGIYSVNPAWLTASGSPTEENEEESINSESLSVNEASIDETTTE